ncbi:MAG: YbjQ family protein [Planctomycetes bacterium]|nr:YbjQ family protein [Planctomycetota bacterium]
MIDPRFITTANELHGYRVSQHCGVVRGIIVRSRSAIGNFAAGIQTFFGGNISLYTELCEQARQEAYDLMCIHAAEAGANAIIGMRYESNDVAPSVTEVLCYGTAVIVSLPQANPPATEQPGPAA